MRRTFTTKNHYIDDKQKLTSQASTFTCFLNNRPSTKSRSNEDNASSYPVHAPSRPAVASLRDWAGTPRLVEKPRSTESPKR
jgi:hypothetical protein